MIRTITPIFSIIVALLIFFFFTEPMFVEVKQVRDETTQFNEAAARASELNDELSRKLAEKRSYPAEALERLDALVPSSIDEVKVLTDVSEMARNHNMLFGNVSIVEPEATEGASTMDSEIPVENIPLYDQLETVDIQFSLIGSYDEFKAFLTDLEHSLVMLEVTGIDFKAGDGELQQYDMSARAFALPPSE